MQQRFGDYVFGHASLEKTTVIAKNLLFVEVEFIFA